MQIEKGENAVKGGGCPTVLNPSLFIPAGPSFDYAYQTLAHRRGLVTQMQHVRRRRPIILSIFPFLKHLLFSTHSDASGFSVSRGRWAGRIHSGA